MATMNMTMKKTTMNTKKTMTNTKKMMTNTKKTTKKNIAKKNAKIMPTKNTAPAYPRTLLSATEKPKKAWA